MFTIICLPNNIFCYSLISNSLTNYGRRHFKLFTNCHVSWDTLQHTVSLIKNFDSTLYHQFRILIVNYNKKKNLDSTLNHQFRILLEHCIIKKNFDSSLYHQLKFFLMDPSFSVFQFPKRDVSPLPLITLHIDILTIIQTAKNSCINFETWSTLSFKYTICKCTINTVTPIKQWNIKLTINYGFEQSIQWRTRGVGGSFNITSACISLPQAIYILHCIAMHCTHPVIEQFT